MVMERSGKIDTQRIFRLLGEGLSYRQIAAKMGCSVQYVGQVAKRLGRYGTARKRQAAARMQRPGK